MQSLFNFRLCEPKASQFSSDSKSRRGFMLDQTYAAVGEHLMEVSRKASNFPLDLSVGKEPKQVNTENSKSFTSRSALLGTGIFTSF